MAGVLWTRRLTVRRVEAEDWRAIQAIWERQEQSPYARYDRPNDTGDEAVRARIAKWSSFAGSREHLFFAVCLEGAVIGYVVFHAREEGFETGYCFHDAYHGKGYAGESISVLMDELRRWGVGKLTAGTALDNTPSVRLLTSLGFRLAATEQVSFYQDADGRDIYFTGGIFEREL